MPLPLIPIALGLATTAVVVKKMRQPKGLSPERKKVFDNALRNLKDAKKLRQLADAFDKEGHKPEGNELRKRANVIAAPKDVKNKRKAIFKKALNSKKPAAVKKTAAAFHQQGYYDAAAKLRAYSRGLLNPLAHGELDYDSLESQDDFGPNNSMADFESTVDDADRDAVIDTTAEEVEDDDDEDDEDDDVAAGEGDEDDDEDDAPDSDDDDDDDDVEDEDDEDENLEGSSEVEDGDASEED